MSEILVGGSCQACGGLYGEHWPHCEVAARTAEPEKPSLEDRIEQIVNSFNRQVCEERDELKRKCRELQAIIDTHDLCHDLEGKVGRKEFEEGCRRKTIEVFGSCGWAEELATLRARVDELEGRLRRVECSTLPIGGTL